MSNKFEVIKYRFRLDDPQVLLIQGWFQHNKKGNESIEVCLDNEILGISIEERSNQAIKNKNLSESRFIDTEYYIWVNLPENFESKHSIQINRVESGEKHQIVKLKIKDILEFRKGIEGFIDSAELDHGNAVIKGWLASCEKADISIANVKGEKIKAEIKLKRRKDVLLEYPEAKEENVIGLEIKIPNCQEKNIFVVVKCEHRKYKKRCQLQYSPVEKAISFTNQWRKKGVAYYRHKGFLGTVKRAYVKIFQTEKKEYEKWRADHVPTGVMLQAQRKAKFDYEPKISIVIPLYKTPLNYLDELIQSIKNQTYSNWELCLSDGSGPNSPLESKLQQYQAKDPRIKVAYEKKAMQISENTNAALKIATGEYIAFGDHDDLLTLDAFYETVATINQHLDADLIYSDEDKISMDGKKYFEPHFKPDFNLDLLNTTNYICHLCVVRKTLLDQVGYLRTEFDGAQDYDFVLRCTESTKHVYHIPKVLYHWRAHKDSTAENPESKMYAFIAGQKAVQAHYGRVGINATVHQTKYLGIYRSEYHLEDQPLVSIIIPNRDHIKDLDKCIDSIESKSTYPNLEYIVIENNSERKETFEYYKKLQAQNKRVNVVTWEGEFNYSAINNFGVQFAKGDYYLLLNNDTEIINKSCIEELLGFCMRPEVGIVGARLFYKDDTVQHAGVVIGLGGLAGHAFVGLPREAAGYFARPLCAQNYSAVTAACLMVKKSVYEEVGGLNEDLKVAFNDVDFCLKVCQLGKLIVYNPYAQLYHFESKSRGQDDTEEKTKRFDGEVELACTIWNDYLKKGDPYYNPNLTLAKGDFSLR